MSSTESPPQKSAQRSIGKNPQPNAAASSRVASAALAYSSSIDEILQARFGLRDFRKGQRGIIESILAAHDTMAVMPTGGGKSLCYQLPAVVLNRLVIVILL